MHLRDTPRHLCLSSLVVMNTTDSKDYLPTQPCHRLPEEAKLSVFPGMPVILFLYEVIPRCTFSSSSGIYILL